MILMICTNVMFVLSLTPGDAHVVGGSTRQQRQVMVVMETDVSRTEGCRSVDV